MSKLSWRGSTVLVTGGSGTFGRRLVRMLLEKPKAKRIVVFSRDEQKQHEMKHAGYDSPRIEYCLGDVRDAKSIGEAMAGVDLVVHAAALKHVPFSEAQPLQVVQTNVLGTENVVAAAIAQRVRRVIALSTDKAVQPVNAYGATKLLAERLVIEANTRRGNRGTMLSCVRYGNVLASRGSLVPVLRAQRSKGRVTVTDPRMTRFWTSPGEAAAFVVQCAGRMRGGEVFVMRALAAPVLDVVAQVAPGCKVDVVGVRRGEKIHEVLLSEEESPLAEERDGMFVVRPLTAKPGAARPRYASDDAPRLSAEALRAMCSDEQEQEKRDERPEVIEHPARPRLVR